MTTSPVLDPLLLEWFRRNGEANANLLGLLTPADFPLSFNAGGRSIGALLGHMVYSRTGWLKKLSPEHAGSIPEVSSGGWSGEPLTVTTTEEIAEAFRLADLAIVTAVAGAIGEGRGFGPEFASHPAHLIQLQMLNDASHRSQILAAIRLSGTRTPGERQALEDAVWDPWFA